MPAVGVVGAGLVLAASAVLATRVSWGLWVCLAVIVVVVVVALAGLTKVRRVPARAEPAYVGPPPVTQPEVPAVLFTHGPRPEQVLGKLSRRLLALIGRMIAHLEELEKETEDPDQLAGLFKLDHVATQLRRQVENIEVMRGEGGLLNREESPLPVWQVLMSACGEIEQYRQVDVLPSPDVLVHGRAVAEVIHLIAELAENATQFQDPTSPPVEVRSQEVPAGLWIQIRDRGVGIPDRAREDYNHLLAPATPLDLDKVLTKDQIGLAVVKELSQRFGIPVQLNNNMFGGTDADIVLPRELLLAPVVEEPVPVAVPNPAPVPHPEQGRHSRSGGESGALPKRRPPSPVRRPVEPADAPAADTTITVAAEAERPADEAPAPDSGLLPAPKDQGLPPLPRRSTAASHLPAPLRTPSEEPSVYTGATSSLSADFRDGLAEGIADNAERPDPEISWPEANPAPHGGTSWN